MQQQIHPRHFVPAKEPVQHVMPLRAKNQSLDVAREEYEGRADLLPVQVILALQEARVLLHAPYALFPGWAIKLQSKFL